MDGERPILTPWAAACHEAAHAFCYLHFGREFDEMFLIWNGDKVVRGGVEIGKQRHDDWWAKATESRTVDCEWLVGIVVGREAHLIAGSGVHDPRWTEDDDGAAQEVAKFAGAEPDFDDEESVRRALDAVPGLVEAEVDAGRVKARRLVKTHWAVVERLARALLDAEKLPDGENESRFKQTLDLESAKTVLGE